METCKVKTISSTNLIKFNLIHGIQSSKRDCQRRKLWR